jgi:hypothetical protein
MFDLYAWHKTLHEVTGSMALRWLKAAPSELVEWARELRAIAAAMEAAASEGRPLTEAEPAKANPIPGWLLEDVKTGHI